MPPNYEIVEAKLAQIEAEMKRIGMWQKETPSPENLVVTKAFGADKLSFDQWLQFIFIPRVKDILAEKGSFPSGSQVSAQAYREWKMWGDEPNVDQLLQLLQEFDMLFV